MTAAAALTKTCTCGRDFGRFFDYCPICPSAEKLTFKAEPVVAATPAPVLQPTMQAPTTPVPVMPAVATARRPSPIETENTIGRGGIPRLLKLFGLPGAVAAVIAYAVLLPTTVKTLEVQVDADQWQIFDLRKHFAPGSQFVVTADAPLRLRTEAGKPITTAVGAVSLGELADGKIEVRAVKGNARVSFAQR